MQQVTEVWVLGLGSGTGCIAAPLLANIADFRNQRDVNMTTKDNNNRRAHLGDVQLAVEVERAVHKQVQC
jgi:hypothetical protein